MNPITEQREKLFDSRAPVSDAEFSRAIGSSQDGHCIVVVLREAIARRCHCQREVIYPGDRLGTISEVMEEKGGLFDITSGRWDIMAYRLHVITAFESIYATAMPGRLWKTVLKDWPSWPICKQHERILDEEAKHQILTVGEWIGEAVRIIIGNWPKDIPRPGAANHL